jgi:hypothetical protein
MCEGVELWLHPFLTSASDWDQWLVSRPDSYTPEEKVLVTIL